MKYLAFVAALGLATAGGVTRPAAASQALPAAHTMSDGIVQVEGGCGPGGHRGPYGRCVENRRRMERGCPRHMHPNRYGRCSPNY